MKISEFLSLDGITVDVRASDKRQLVEEVARKAATTLNVPADHIASELLKREQLGSTGTGDGVAIPHARIRGVMKPFGLLVKLREPMDFDAIDAQPVDLIFVLLLPADAEGDRLGALASISRKLRAPQAAARMRQMKRPAELYALICE